MSHEQKTFTVYIVASRSRILYTGVTSDLERRVNQHKAKTYPGFTSKYNCNRLVWFRHFEYGGEATAYETELKGLLREKKVALIRAMNPTWEDLSVDWGKPIKLYGEK
jgi:putative endonuclease